MLSIHGMTPDELTVVLKLLQKNQHESVLTALDCQDRIFALESVLVALDSRAAEMLTRQIAEERKRNQKVRDDIRSRIRLIESTLSKIPPKNPN
jgi:hypothetical protein